MTAHNPMPSFAACSHLTERRVELSVRLVTRPRPGTRTKVVVLVIIIVAVLVAWGMGREPVTAVSLVLGAGLAGAQVARALIPGRVPARPEAESGPPALG